MSLEKGPRDHEMLTEPTATPMLALLGEAGDPPPGPTDTYGPGMWHLLEPVNPRVPILLHQTDLAMERKLRQEPRYRFGPPLSPGHRPDWLFTLGPFEASPVTSAIQARAGHFLSLSLRVEGSEGTVTCNWPRVKIAPDFEIGTRKGLTGWWLDWEAESDVDDALFYRILTTETENAHG